TAPVSALMPSVDARRPCSDAGQAPIASTSITAVNAKVHEADRTSCCRRLADRRHACADVSEWYEVGETVPESRKKPAKGQNRDHANVGQSEGEQADAATLAGKPKTQAPGAGQKCSLSCG